MNNSDWIAATIWYQRWRNAVENARRGHEEYQLAAVLAQVQYVCYIALGIAKIPQDQRPIS